MTSTPSSVHRLSSVKLTSMAVSVLRLASIIAEIINGGLAQPSFTQQDAEAYGEEEEDDQDPW
jgi:hypothetical protein